MTRFVVIGAGIVGVATAYELSRRHPDATVTVLEKENRVAAHQTGHNSGVVHAGVYYRPGSLRARLCVAGNRSMVNFCTTHGIPVEITGKLIVATGENELPRLRTLHERTVANGIPARLITPDEARDHEPHVRCVAAMHVPASGIVDFGAVSRTLAGLFIERGGEIRLGARVTGIRPGAPTTVHTTAGDVPADIMVNCAGLHADRVARLAGVTPPARIVPFRGEYYELRPERRHLVRGLIYPVPDPRLPFLGVHLTRAVDGSVHAGPNAVLALAREGYSWRRVNLRDLAEVAGYPGLWRLALRHLRYGLTEVRRSLSPRLFATAVARLVPELTAADLRRAGAGVRAQNVMPGGEMVDDFLVVTLPGQVHVLNAPSPAATSALEIARHLVTSMPE
jgi:(S)-2-hydroxyglutarate dehydrogenase